MLNLWQQLAGELDTLRHACTRCGRRDWRRGWRNALDAQTRRFGVYGCGEIGGEGRKGRGSDGDGLGEGEGCRRGCRQRRRAGAEEEQVVGAFAEWWAPGWGARGEDDEGAFYVGCGCCCFWGKGGEGCGGYLVGAVRVGFLSFAVVPGFVGTLADEGVGVGGGEETWVQEGGDGVDVADKELVGVECAGEATTGVMGVIGAANVGHQ
ncbi:hypothetical protein HO173_009087 [Letharia columbiana]|uniref:Uncharacterized protein n=1 Tax=Letharia columbiana TaxID=112416 RepID=A0A8H6FQ67_9LECA|nr:uncharacterized protein HO173_009087 [Letharia columbiana]KAF6232648.1 hypothetical protein HO173_009087 [Letharia columbiana]